MRYIPNSPEEREQMLNSVGLTSAGDLFRSLPEDILLGRELAINEPYAEPEVIREMQALAEMNPATRKTRFLGAGVYTHFSPTIVDNLIQRSEFFTSYTPYQPEISQGTLQYVFEFQTLVCQLTGMEVANASMYDGSTSMAEAILMAQRVTRKNKVLVAETVHPEYIEVAKTYTRHSDLVFETIAFDPGSARVDEGGLSGLDDDTAALVVQSPNFFGSIENLEALAEKAHEAGALLIVVVTEAVSFGLLRTPGDCGADIVVAEGQSFGVPASFGGPHVGLFACRQKHVRQMPGRLAGVAYDKDGNRGFVLTLATREQHIRRDKATSNICTNEGLIALAATIYLETMGRRGMREVAEQNVRKCAYAKAGIRETEGFEVAFEAPVFNEFVVRGESGAQELLDRLSNNYGIIAGVPVSRYYQGRPNEFVVCVTECNTRTEIDELLKALKECK